MSEIMEVPALHHAMSRCKYGVDGMNAPSSGIEALDELLHLPHLNVLLCLILTHFDDSARPSASLYVQQKRRKQRKGRAESAGGGCGREEEFPSHSIFIRRQQTPSVHIGYAERGTR